MHPPESTSATNAPRPYPRALVAGVLAVLAPAACGESGTRLSGEPQLVSLEIAPIALAPPFSPDIHDYVVRCGPGPNSLFVSPTAPPGMTATVRARAAPSSVRLDGVTLDVDDDDAIVVDVAGNDATSSYWVRCLPPDFPDIAVTRSGGGPSPGWYLVGNAECTQSESGFAMILDVNGTPVWYQRVAPNGTLGVDRLADGRVSYVANLGVYGTNPDARYLIQSLQPWSQRDVAAVGSPIDQHDLRLLPNGDVLVLSYVLVANVDLTGLGAYGAGATIADCEVQEIGPAGALVWEWRASQHIDPVRESNAAEVGPGGPGVADVFHLNSIDVDSNGNLLISSRNTDAVYYVDRSTGRVVWKLGGASTNKDGAQIVRVAGDPEGRFGAQHDARFEGNGISLFDDHTGLDGVARGVEYAIDLAAGQARFVAQVAGSGTSGSLGSFRSTYDGGHLVAWGLAQHPSLSWSAFTDFDPSGAARLDFRFASGDATYRAVKVPPADFDIDVLRATAGLSTAVGP